MRARRVSTESSTTRTLVTTTRGRAQAPEARNRRPPPNRTRSHGNYTHKLRGRKLPEVGAHTISARPVEANRPALVRHLRAAARRPPEAIRQCCALKADLVPAPADAGSLVPMTALMLPTSCRAAQCAQAPATSRGGGPPPNAGTPPSRRSAGPMGRRSPSSMDASSSTRHKVRTHGQGGWGESAHPRASFDKSGRRAHCRGGDV